MCYVTDVTHLCFVAGLGEVTNYQPLECGTSITIREPLELN